MVHKERDVIYKKIRPFFEDLKKKDVNAWEKFDAADWLREGTAAYEFSKKHLTKKERKWLREAVYAEMLLGG